ncbi:MAG: hypothetical protein D6706_06405 [Chloroflexi bacterium]|nr:MAG: hypothetical protein D6706_06405 [Chloroflexota bacterium]
MEQLIGLILATVAGIITLAFCLTVLVFLLPNYTARARHTIAQTPQRAFLIGLVNALFFGVLTGVLGQGGDIGGLLAVLVVLGLLALTTVGLAGLLLHLRQRIYPTVKEDGAWIVTVKTAVFLLLAAIAPLVGWFLLTPIALITALGTGIMVLLRRTPPPTNEDLTLPG